MSSCIEKKLFKSRFGRCSYNSMKQIIDLHGTRFAQLEYYVVVFIFFYINFRLLLFVYFSRIDFKYDTRWQYNISRDDPIMNYLYQNKERYGEEIGFICIFMELFNFLFQNALYRLNVNTFVWHWWYQMIVTNQDDYYQFHFENFELMKLTKSLKLIKSMKTHRFWSILPNFIIKFLANLHTRLMIQYNLEQIDKNKFLEKKLTVLPNLSNRLRLKLINVLIIADRFVCLFQLFLGMFTLKLLNFIFSKF